MACILCLSCNRRMSNLNTDGDKKGTKELLAERTEAAKKWKSKFGAAYQGDTCPPEWKEHVDRYTAVTLVSAG